MTNTTGKNIWALLVGINYEGTAIRKLSGCVNDVLAMKRFLIEQMGVPESQIKTLIEEEAKRTTIIKMFDTFLIKNDKIPAGAQILFQYSGHGSQMPSRSKFEPDGRDETIVPYDSRTHRVYDIPDKTLAGLIDALAQAKGNNITVVLDCCHSGSGTRAIPPSTNTQLNTRRVEFDSRTPPAELDAEWYKFSNVGANMSVPSPTRSLGPSGWELVSPTHVLLAGCRASEESHEHRVAGDDATVQGALTYFMLDWLRTMQTGASYADLHEVVSARVNTVYFDQMPQCEGDRNRQVLGGAQVQRDPFAKITAVEDGIVTLDCGIVQGMSVDDEIAIYPASLKTLHDAQTIAPIACAKITLAGGTTSMAEITQMPTSPIEVNSRVVVAKRVATGARLAVWLDDVQNLAREVVLARIAFSELLSLAPTKPNADVIVRSDADANYHVYEPSGRALCDLSPTPDELCNKLEHMARYRLVQKLSNNNPSQLRIKASLYQYDAASKKMTVIAPNAGGELVLTHKEGGNKFNRYVLKIENQSDVPVFANIFYLESNFSITARYPKLSEPEQIEPNSTWVYGLNDKDKLLIGLAEGEESVRDRIKVIATTKPAELGLLAQDRLKPPPRAVPLSTKRGNESVLTRLLRAKTSATRGQLADDDAIDDDWTTADIVFHVERGGVTKALPIGAIDQPLWVGKIAITQKPAALIGKITVESFEADAHRGVGEGIVLPPALTLHPELCQLIGGADTRSVGDAGLVVKIDVDETTRTAVSPTSPLILDVRQLDPSAETLAVMHDGEDFLLVGGGEKGLVTINALPEDRARTRANVVRSLRLYLFKKIGQYTPELGLHYFERGGDVSKPRLPTRADFKPGDTVALMVHGFLSDTGWMADDVADFLRKDVLDYDHVLGWDYETVGTGINQNGEGLAKELRRRCGFGANDGITVHLFAHSMGCVVSRCMIELHGGDKFIDKALFAGAPNLGTRAADATRGLAYLITLLLNNVSIIPGPSWLGKAVAAGFGWLVNNATGWSDLKTNSDILKEINELDEPNTTPYLVLAGLNKRQDQAAGQAERIAVKLLDQGLDAFYGEDNDIVIGKHCMTDMRMGTYPLLTVQTLSCDHGAYFVDTAGRETITTWVTKQPM